MDNCRDEYGELLGMPNEVEDRGTGALLYEPAEADALQAERLRASRLKEAPVTQIQMVPVITQAPRVLRSAYKLPGVTRGGQTDPVQQSQGQQVDLPENIDRRACQPMRYSKLPAFQWRRGGWRPAGKETVTIDKKGGTGGKQLGRRGTFLYQRRTQTCLWRSPGLGRRQSSYVGGSLRCRLKSTTHQ